MIENRQQTMRERHQVYLQRKLNTFFRRSSDDIQRMKQFRSRRNNYQSSIYTTITASLPFIEVNLKLKPSQMYMLVNGLKYIVPCQSRFSRTSIDHIITEQYRSISTTIKNCPT